MMGRGLTLAAMATLLVVTAKAQDSFDTAPQQQGAFPQAQQGQGYPPQQGGAPQARQGQGYPPRQGSSQPPTAPQGAGNLDRLMQVERQDFGVPPTGQLHAGPMHGPTPASIPGGQVITTKGLLSLIEARQVPFVLLDVLGAPETIPASVLAVPAHQPGSLNDRVQQEFGAFLQDVTGGNRETPLVLYCLSNQCWMSYNAALRAIHLGYTNVLWYRGGLEAWKAAGQATQPAPTGYLQR